MNRLSLFDIYKNDEWKLDDVSSPILVCLNGEEINSNEPINLTIPSNVSINLFVFNITNSVALNCVLKEGASLQISGLYTKNEKSFVLHAIVEKNAVFSGYFGDFSLSDDNINVNIDLNGENAKCDWHLACISQNENHKNIEVNVNHNIGYTTGNVESYGVAKDKSHLLLSGTSDIKNKSIKSSTHQTAKIMVFDPLAVGNASPKLLIDENDVVAGHAAVVGKVNDDHLFYLESRGLSELQAKELIIFGYLNPILCGFDEDIRNEITSLIKEKI